MLALLAASGGVRAAAPDAPYNPYANLDPDGVPLAATPGQDKPSPDEAISLQQQADAMERARNWLLIDYEQQVQRRNTDAPGEDKTSNVYLELSLNKDLARLAGLTAIEANNSPTHPELRTTQDASTRNGMGLRQADSPGSGAFTPLITPLGSSAASSATQPFFITTYSAPLPNTLVPGSSFLGTPTQSPAPAPARAKAPNAQAGLVSPYDTVEMQTPGMVADKDSPISGTPDLNLGSLPDQNPDDSQANPNADQPAQLPQLPQAMTVDQLHLELNAKLKPTVPAAVQGQATAQAQQQNPNQTKPQQPPPPEEPMPISQQPVLSPVHAPLPDPYSILKR
jgi:hypothetical protein